MSGSVDLTMETGSIWSWSFVWKDAFGVTVPFDTPIMNIRQDLSPKGNLIAVLDESGAYNGTLSIPEPGTLIVNMSPDQTGLLSSGYGFWDIFVNAYGNRVRLLFGTVAIAAHVTELS
jgi:hypothetical protein